jgi:ubiquinone/menaquinone biosynthesis C-methylase UbiE
MDYETIYREHADRYDELIAAEDCDGALLPALAAIAPLDGAVLLDVGTGTGRIPRLVVGRARRVIGVEPSPAMLEVASRHLQATGRSNWELHRGDAGHLPVASEVADVAMAAWVFGHFRHWLPDGWRKEIARAIGELDRCLKPGGTAIVIETLGTGAEAPGAPNDALGEYYRWLEEEMGFVRKELRTDYLFPDPATAAAICGFFFGADFGARVVREGWSRVPEHTGLWWRMQSE